MSGAVKMSVKMGVKMSVKMGDTVFAGKNTPCGRFIGISAAVSVAVADRILLLLFQFCTA